MDMPENNVIRAMVDANVLIAGIAWPRFAYEVLQHAANGDYKLVLSPIVIEEATYSIAAIQPANINRHALQNFLESVPYELVSSPRIEEIEANWGLIRDPKDVHVVLAAVNAQVDLLITQDKDFFDEHESTKQVKERLNVIVPGAFLRNYMSWTSEALENIRKRTWQDFVSELDVE
jgi:putative PIN family toxin of toxin-antitoxin system